jgi:hypothetical protein
MKEVKDLNKWIGWLDSWIRCLEGLKRSLPLHQQINEYMHKISREGQKNSNDQQNNF